MALLKAIGTTILLVIFSVTIFATTWGPVYPYIQKTESGKVKSNSVPYGVYDGPYGLGETFVFFNGKLIYTIDKYFSSPFLTTNNGQYLIELNFSIEFLQPDGIIDKSGKETLFPSIYDGQAVNIYKDGTLFKTIDFVELQIDTSKIKVNEFGNLFAWNYCINDSTKDELIIKMNKFSAFIENNKLYLITADNQLITIEISTGQITNRQNAYETLEQKSNWSPTTFKRKFKKVQYPDKFSLPKLQNGKTIEQGLAEYFNKIACSGDRDSAIIEIYFRSLLINKKGRCEVVYVSPRMLTNLKSDSMNGLDSQKLKVEIENWIKQQTFKTNTFPRGFQKFKYKDYVYLK